MSSDFERIIRRDLDQLPVLPVERWIPRSGDQNSPARLARRSLIALAVVVLAAGAGLSVARIRADVARPAARPAEVATGPAQTALGRQAVLSLIRGRSRDLPAISRIEAKLVSKGDLQSTGSQLGVSPAVVAALPGDLAWVVSVAGDVRCSACTGDPPPQPFRSVLYLVEPHSGAVLAARFWSEDWPAAFDDLIDRAVGEIAR